MYLGFDLINMWPLSDQPEVAVRNVHAADALLGTSVVWAAR